MTQHLVNALVLGSILSLFSLGLSLCWGALDALNLAHGATFIFGAFAAARLALSLDLPFVLIVLLAMAAAGVVAALLEVLAFRRIRNSQASKRQIELAMLLASVGAGTVLDQIVHNATGGVTFRITGFEVSVLNIAGVTVTNIQLIIIGVATVVSVALTYWIGRGRTGRAIRAVAFSPGIARHLGIEVSQVALVTMFVSGALAGLAGVLLTINLAGVDVYTGHTYLMMGFAVLIVGGVGSVGGAVAAAYILAIVQVAIAAYGPGELQVGVAFLVIFLVLIFKPNGLFSQQRAIRA